jgi:N-carbamoyl-L-amino-acid hydrolase
VLTCDRERLVETIREQAAIGGTDQGGFHRLALSDADRAVRDWFVEQLEAAGLSVRIDEFGNVFGRREGTDSNASPILLGSHLDSQPYGGIYDGALGVVAALEFVRRLNDEDLETARPVEVVNWTNEEGSRFQPVMQGSGVWAGELDREDEYARTDAEGTTVEEALERTGYRGSVPAEPQSDYDSYLELHIEQGPVLDRQDRDVGVVTGFVGLSWGAITFYGDSNHTGTTPMHARQDALIAAADFITGVRRIAGTVGENTVGSVGRLECAPNSINAIPGEVTVTWGVRDPDNAVVETARDRVLAEAKAAADREGVDWEFEDRARSESVHFPDRIVSVVQRAADDLGLESERLFGGAVHDAAHVATVCDAGMVFAVSEDGKSHTESEYTSWDDCRAAADTYLTAAHELATRT